MEVLKTTDKIFQQNTDSGDHGLPEVFAFKSIREHDNSVDALCVNPKSEKEFATASHDQVIKIWDAPNFKCRSTLKGHTKGVWSLAYDGDGKRLLSCSPDATAKIWDVKSGKAVTDLVAHEQFCYKAAFDSDSAYVATVGADKKMMYWDLRSTAKPVFVNEESKAVLMGCDFMPNDQQIITTSIAGEISVISVKKQTRVFYHDTIPGMIKKDKENQLPPDAMEESRPKKFQQKPPKKESDYSNIIYLCKTVRTVPDEDNVFLIGAEDARISKIKMDYNGVDIFDFFGGHSAGIRSIEVSGDGSTMISGCEDHSLRIWDYQTCKSKCILSGHKDVVTGGVFLNPSTLVSCSWDMTIKAWKV